MVVARVVLEPGAVTDENALELFRMGTVWCGTYGHLPFEECYRGGRPKEADTTIFSRLARAYAGGHQDEALYLAAALAARGLNRGLAEGLRSGSVVLRARTPAEVAILEVGLRVALCAAHGVDGAPALCAEEEFTNHVLLGLLSPNSRVHVVSASSRPPGFANSFALDPVQPLSNDPPLGLIPNNLSLCYGASALTLLLSLPLVARALALGPVEGAAASALRIYAHHLKTGALGEEEVRELNRCMVQIPEFRRFGHGEADDSKPFAEAVLGVLLGCRGLGLEGAFGKGIYTIPSMVQVRDPVQGPTGPPGELPFRIARETLACGGVALDFRTEPGVLPGAPGHAIGGEYADRKGRPLGSFSAIVERALEGARPKILLLDHRIAGSEAAGKFAMPSRVELEGGAVYSMHGASMFDMHTTGGHYTSMILSRTTMYFYDPQYDPASEDMRLYRPRLLCYVRVDAKG